MLIKNLGPIKSADLTLNSETIFLGYNNSGKTFVSYALYGIFDYINKQNFDWITDDNAKKILLNHEKLTVDINEIEQYYSSELDKQVKNNLKKILCKTFNEPETNFEETTITFSKDELFYFVKNEYSKSEEVMNRSYGRYKNNYFVVNFKLCDDNHAEIYMDEVDNDFLTNRIQGNLDEKALDIFKLVVNRMVSRFFLLSENILYIPAERNGLNVFRKELLVKRSRAFDEIEGEFSKKENRQLYPSPIANYLDYLNNIQITRDFLWGVKRSSDIEVGKLSEYFLSKVLKGKYEYDSDSEEIFYRELYYTSSKGNKYKTLKTPFHISSSSAKTLFGIDTYLEVLASKNDIIFIDEPEMNLDPERQIEFGKLLTRMSKYGIKVFISTHSDLLVRSTANNLLRDKLEGNDSDYVNCFSFRNKKIEYINSLIENDYIENFDVPNQRLDDEYYQFQEKLKED